ncbi:MAG: hypothetical protein ACT4QF_22305 [Sporichthyaceae bacterium]
MFARRRRRGLDIALVASAVGLALLAVYLPGSADPQPAAAADEQPLTVPGVTPSAVPTASPAPVEMPVAEDLPPVKLAPGEKPPQFVVFSFDGAGSTERWKYYRDIAKSTNSTYTYYLSGPYWLPDAKKNSYRPPNFPVGYSEVGFGGTDAEVRERAEQAQLAFNEGHEIGTHFNGHMCGAKGVAAFSGANWSDELEQWYQIVEQWRANANATDAAANPFTRKDVIGARTPCLEGKRSVFLPVLENNGFRYDTSGWGYLQWPKKTDTTSLWDIPLQVMKMAGTGRQVLSMDYNFYEIQGKVTTPASRAAMQDQMVRTYRNAFNAVYEDNRAPLIIGHHFAEWNLGVYHDALGSFMKETCGKPEVKCVNFTQLVDWLDVQDPAEIAKLRAEGIANMKY